MEYLYIKNFGSRLTGEKFLKLPHGPTIAGYAKQIEKMHVVGALDVDVPKLNEKKTVEDFNVKIPIRKTDLTKRFLFPDRNVLAFIYGVADRYGNCTIDELEKVVYATVPMVNYKRSFFKRAIGGYVLTGDCVRLKDYKNPITEGRKRALDHARTYPDVNWEQQKNLVEEFKPLEHLRPQHE